MAFISVLSIWACQIDLLAFMLMIASPLTFSTVQRNVPFGGASDTLVNLNNDFILSPSVSLVVFMAMKIFCTGKGKIVEKLRTI